MVSLWVFRITLAVAHFARENLQSAKVLPQGFAD
jgi:hypothetical protein